MNKLDLQTPLEWLDPCQLDYQQWLSVGMALKTEGYDLGIWENWSQRDSSRYHSGECAKKWNGFRGSAITGGTLVQMAKEQGFRMEGSDTGMCLDWNSVIGAQEKTVVQADWLEAQEVSQPLDWNPVQELTTYLETLFDTSENVGYVTKSWEKGGKFLPTQGVFNRTAGQLIERLSKCDPADIGAVVGDYSQQAGAWIRFNPLDGQGVKNSNVTDFRYALVESDDMEIETQYALIRELELPVATLVHSGGKSLHAVVRIDAVDYPEYRKRVDYLYDVLKKNGLSVDTQNKNPSRLSRMPGIMRNGNKQFLLATNIGRENFVQWQDWVLSQTDELPDTESLATVWDNLPDLAPPLIHGILRQGHKMLLAGPSKAGKSFALIELCIALAEGVPWLGFACQRGKVLYVNLELDKASCFHRFRDVYEGLGVKPSHLHHIDIWNLRGKSVPMDALAPKLIRRAMKKNYLAIVIDPIYKIITGDENSADQMAKFCNQFDRVCTELGCAVIYCHHHSKGGQGGKKSMDRASGSGVFARDPDSLLDLVELDLTQDIRASRRQQATVRAYETVLETACPDWEMAVGLDDRHSEVAMADYCKTNLSQAEWSRAQALATTQKKVADSHTAWRLEGTLREFPKLNPMHLWFAYPVHKIDEVGVLADVAIGESTRSWKQNFAQKKTPTQQKTDRKTGVETAFEACHMGGDVTLKALSEYMGVTEKTVRNRLKEHGGYWVEDGKIGRK